MIFFAGKGGLSGDIWLATMLAAIGSGEPIERVTKSLPWMSATLQVSEQEEETTARIVIKGAEDSPMQTGQDMRYFLLKTDFEWEVKETALEALYSRQLAEARGLGFPLEKRQYTGKEVGDTLFDILGGIYFWDLLGRPAVSLADYLDVGFFPPPATRKLLEDIPNKTPRRERELTTPTAAALLKATYSEQEMPKREADLVVVSGGRYAEEGRIDKTRSWHYLS